MTDRGAAPHPYLAGLVLTGRKVVVVGGGHVAQRRVSGLLGAGADVTVVSLDVTPALEGLQGELTLVLREFTETDLDGAWYVVAATDDPTVNARVYLCGSCLKQSGSPCQPTLSNGLTSNSNMRDISRENDRQQLASREWMNSSCQPTWTTRHSMHCRPKLDRSSVWPIRALLVRPVGSLASLPVIFRAWSSQSFSGGEARLFHVKQCHDHEYESPLRSPGCVSVARSAPIPACYCPSQPPFYI